MVKPLQFLSLLLAGVVMIGCERTTDSDYEEAVEAQAELEEARQEAAEIVSEAESEAIEAVRDARIEAKEEIEQTKQEAAEKVQDAEQKLQSRLENLSEKPVAPTTEPAGEEGVVVERKVIVETETTGDPL